MRIYLRGQDGFTFLESLLVLSIVTVIISISIVKLSPVKERQIMTHFIQQLRDDLLYAQQYAMSSNQSVRVIFFPSDYYYRIVGTKTPTELVNRKYDPAIEIRSWTIGNTITFTRTGTISSSGTYAISYKGRERYSLVFQIGFGRFYVQKL